jgi:hypothetical protein
VLLSFDVPAVRPYPGYVGRLIDAAGAEVWRIPISATQAQDTVSISVPPGVLRPGDYTLVIAGVDARVPGDAAAPNTSDLARYRFLINESRGIP